MQFRIALLFTWPTHAQKQLKMFPPRFTILGFNLAQADLFHSSQIEATRDIYFYNYIMYDAL